MITKENALELSDMVESVNGIDRSSTSLIFERGDNKFEKVFYLKSFIDISVYPPEEININHFGYVSIYGRLDSSYVSPASPLITMRTLNPEFGVNRYSRKPYIGEVFDEYFQDNFPAAFRGNGVPIDYVTYNKWMSLFEYQEYNPRQLIKDLARVVKALNEFWSELKETFSDS